MPESDFSMTVFRRAGRKCFECQWVDPTTGKKKTRTTGAKTQKEADRFAGKLLDELRSGRFKEMHLVTWDEFTERYTLEVVPSLADRTAGKVQGLFNIVNRIIAPKLLTAMDATQISRLQTAMRSEGLSEATIKSHLAHLKAALNWGKSVGILAEVPKIKMPTRTATMKGRPITLEEFERMIGKVPDVVCAKRPEKATEERRAAAEAIADRAAESWRRLLRGLWLSGLRLSEALNLNWTDDRLISVDLSGRRPMLRIQPEGQKSGKLTMTPITPDFAEFLQAVPDDRRRGFVFNPLDERGERRLSRVDVVSGLICAIGKAAAVKVSEKSDRRRKTGDPRIKYASAHDFRGAFGERWSTRVTTPVLQQLMRHESITTTLQFYAGRNAETAADAVFDAFANTFANSRPKPSVFQPEESTQDAEAKGFED